MIQAKGNFTVTTKKRKCKHDGFYFVNVISEYINGKWVKINESDNYDNREDAIRWGEILLDEAVLLSTMTESQRQEYCSL